MQFSDKLNLLLSKKGMTQAELADAISVSRQAVQVWASGRSEPRGTNLVRICEFFNVSPDWFRSDAELDLTDERVKVFVPNEETHPGGYVAIPEYRLTFSAGNSGAQATWEEVNDSTVAWYRNSYLKSRGVNPDRCCRSKVRGDSMEPLLHDGDTILWEHGTVTDPKCVPIVDGALYVLTVGDGERVKKISRIKDGLRIISLNPIYPYEDYVGQEVDQIRIFGKVIEVNHTL